MSPGQSKCTMHTPPSRYSGTVRYIVLNKNGTANELEASSRNYNPLAIFNDLKCVVSLFHFQPFSGDAPYRLQSNLAHLETHIRVRTTDLALLHSK